MSKSEARRIAEQMGLRPLGDRIIAKPIDAETKTASGILLPEATAEKSKPELADVIAVANDVEDVEVGDRIVYEKYVPSKFTKDKVDYLILSVDDVLAVVVA